MQEAILEPRPLYGIGTVARLTGLKPDTLRVWERRYGLGASHKSATGRRQYTQSDLEHLQLVAALVRSGSRIGEIANAERKTLEILLRGRGKGAAFAPPDPKPRAIFVGQGLCDWLEEHQGCLASVDALLARSALPEARQLVAGLGDEVDILVVECATLGASQVADVLALASEMRAGHVIATYQFCNERWLEKLKDEEITGISFPPDPACLAYELGRGGVEKTTSQGDPDLGDLVAAKPRQFTEIELSAARALENRLGCECPRHITDLIRALAQFEEYSANCSVENWHEAAVHSCIYAYTGQARWLMEKALAAVLEERTAEFARAVKSQGREELVDVA